MKVLGSWVCPFSTRVRIALKLKGIEYEFLQETLGVKSELLLQSNPVYKKAPVLIHNGKPVSESMIIVEYIEDVWSSSGNTILPAKPYDRALARFWAPYIDDKFYPTFREIIMAQTEEAKVEAAEKLSVPLLLLEEAFEKCSNEKSFFGGDTIGYLDIALGVYASWILSAEKITGAKILDEEKLPLLVGWAERFRSAEAVKGLMPEADDLVELARKMKDNF